MLVLLISTFTSLRGRDESRGKNKEEKMTGKGASLDVRIIFMHRQKVYFGIMKHLYCHERMLTARSHKTFTAQPACNRVTLFRISRDGVLRKHWNRITKDTRLQESDSVLSDEAAVPRFDTLTMKVEKSTLI